MPTAAASSENAGLLPAQKKMIELLRSQLTKAGVNFKELESLQAKS
jgi:hypothetical protein